MVLKYKVFKRINFVLKLDSLVSVTRGGIPCEGQKAKAALHKVNLFPVINVSQLRFAVRTQLQHGIGTCESPWVLICTTLTWGFNITYLC